jgi:SecD/SecF fusion protein
MIDGLGVSEPLIRIFDKICMKIQIPSISTKDNPEIVDIVKKPAKPEFKLLRPTLIPKLKFEHILIRHEVLSLEYNNSDKQENEYAHVKKYQK